LTPSARATIAIIAEAPNERAILDAIVKSRDPGLDWKLLLGNRGFLFVFFEFLTEFKKYCWIGLFVPAI
jgi:hypothetical protein